MCHIMTVGKIHGSLVHVDSWCISIFPTFQFLSPRTWIILYYSQNFNLQILKSNLWKLDKNTEKLVNLLMKCDREKNPHHSWHDLIKLIFISADCNFPPGKRSRSCRLTFINLHMQLQLQIPLTTLLFHYIQKWKKAPSEKNGHDNDNNHYDWYLNQQSYTWWVKGFIRHPNKSSLLSQMCDVTWKGRKEATQSRSTARIVAGGN